MTDKNKFMNWTLESSIRIALVFLILFITFLIFKPFLLLMVWSIIISIALYPVFKRIEKLFKGKQKFASSLIVIVGLSIIAIPTVYYIGGHIENLSTFSDQISNGSLKIPPPAEGVKDWPIVGKPINDVWLLASKNLDAAFEKFGPQLAKFGSMIFSSIGGLIGSIFLFIGSLIIAGILFLHADSGYKFSIATAERLIGNKGNPIIDSSIATIRSVVKGVLGVAVIQTFLIGIGFVVADIPSASILILATLILALIQIPASLIVIPVIIYVFSVESTTFASIFAIYSILAALSDNILKPILLGRGIEIPMLVILIGSIGGMLLMGIIGLFIGPVIFAISYQLFFDWIALEKKELKETN